VDDVHPKTARFETDWLPGSVARAWPNPVPVTVTAEEVREGRPPSRRKFPGLVSVTAPNQHKESARWTLISIPGNGTAPLVDDAAAKNCGLRPTGCLAISDSNFDVQS
jgi:hypothetical protein